MTKTYHYFTSFLSFANTKKILISLKSNVVLVYLRHLNNNAFQNVCTHQNMNHTFLRRNYYQCDRLLFQFFQKMTYKIIHNQNI